MKLSKWILYIVAVGTLPGGQVMGARTSNVASPAESPVPVVSINGKTVTNEELTSFGLQLEMTEGRRPTQQGLLDEYILTKLYDKIPTTATVEVSGKKSSSPSPYSLLAQRTLIKRELQKQVSTDVKVPREEMETWYKANYAKYQKPERVHAWHLFMETGDQPTSSPEKVRTRLRELKKQIDSGTSFSQEAEKYSEAASGKAGGEIGLITPRMPIGPLSKPMNIELEKAFFELQPNKVSDVVETNHGMHLLYVTEKETTSTPTLDDLITSGILPGVLSQDHITSDIRGLIASTEEKYAGHVLPNGPAHITTDTVAFVLDGKNYTVGNLTEVFGPRFSHYLESAKEDTDNLENLMKQAMDDEALLRAAVDKGLDKKPELTEELKKVGERETANKRISAIAEAESRVTDAEVKQRYETLKDELRQPEVEGVLIEVGSTQSSGTAEEARAREAAHKKAEDIVNRLKAEDFEAVEKSVKSAGDSNTTFTRVPRHVLGQSTDTLTRLFDQSVAAISADSGVSSAVPVGSVYLVGKLEKRYPGEPLPLEAIRERLETMLKTEKQGEVRHDLVKRLEKVADIKYLPGAAEYGKNNDTGTTVTGQLDD